MQIADTTTATEGRNGIIRWYDPVTGRWLSPDPIGIAGGLNMFVFAGNNPVNFRDPFGLCTDDPTIFGIGNLPRGPFPYVQVPSPWLDVPESIANAVPLVGNALLNALAWGVDNFAIDPSDPMAPYIAATFLFAPEFRLIQNASRGLTVKDWFRPGRTVVSNQLIEGPGATGATRTWAIKGGGGRLPFHYHIHQYNWYKPWLWFSQTPIIW